MYASMKPLRFPGKAVTTSSEVWTSFSKNNINSSCGNCLLSICSVRCAFHTTAGINLLRCHWPHFTDGETWVTEAAGSQVGNQNKNILPWPRAVFLLEDPYYSASWWSHLAFLFTAVASASGTFPDHVCTHVMCVLWTDCSVSLSGDSLYKPPSSTLTLLCQAHNRNFITRTEFNFRVTWTHGWETKFWNSWAAHPG